MPLVNFLFLRIISACWIRHEENWLPHLCLGNLNIVRWASLSVNHTFTSLPYLGQNTPRRKHHLLMDVLRLWARLCEAKSNLM